MYGYFNTIYYDSRIWPSFLYLSVRTDKNPKCALHAYIALRMLLETKHLIVQVPSFMGWCQAVLHDTQ